MSLARKFKKAKRMAIRSWMRYVRDNKSEGVKNFWVGVHTLFRPKVKYDLSQPSVFAGHNKQDVLAALHGDGLYNFGKVFSDEEIDAFRESLKGKLLVSGDPTIPPFLKENAPADASILYYQAEDFIPHDLFIKLHFDPFLMDLAQSYLGCKPVINDVGVFNSLVRPEVERKANQTYHRDASDIKFLIIAFYLSDVETPEDGSFSYILGSAKRKEFIKTKVRYTDEEVENTFGKDKIYNLVGKRGTVSISDNFAMHRGLKPTRNERLVHFLCLGVSNLKKPLTPDLIIKDKEKTQKMAKYKHLMDNIAYGFE